MYWEDCDLCLRECLAGNISTAKHDASGGNTTCSATTCGANEWVVVHVCAKCPVGKASTGNQGTSGGNTTYVVTIRGGSTTCEATTGGVNAKNANRV